MDKQALIKKALEARQQAYAPYSGFGVGAALLTADGTVYTGCNIENAAFTPTNCAERTAFFKAISDGKRDFCAIAVAGGPLKGQIDAYCTPCGVCRQVMAEFCTKEFVILCAKSPEDYREYTLLSLLPEAFGPSNL